MYGSACPLPKDRVHFASPQLCGQGRVALISLTNIHIFPSSPIQHFVSVSSPPPFLPEDTALIFQPHLVGVGWCPDFFNKHTHLPLPHHTFFVTDSYFPYPSPLLSTECTPRGVPIFPDPNFMGSALISLTNIHISSRRGGVYFIKFSVSRFSMRQTIGPNRI